MAVRIELTLDCANAARLAAFWKLALGYQDEPPPAPFATRQEMAAAGRPGSWSRRRRVAARPGRNRSPAVAAPGARAQGGQEPPPPGPRVTGTGSPEERWARITQEVDRLTAAGATVLQPLPTHHVVMADPQGNEFCVA